MTSEERLGVALLSLIEYFRYASHMSAGTADVMGLGVTEQDLIDRGWLKWGKGPGRWDADVLIPAGELYVRVLASRGSAVENAYHNHVEQSAA